MKYPIRQMMFVPGLLGLCAASGRIAGAAAIEDNRAKEEAAFFQSLSGTGFQKELEEVREALRRRPPLSIRAISERTFVGEEFALTPGFIAAVKEYTRASAEGAKKCWPLELRRDPVTDAAAAECRRLHIELRRELEKPVLREIRIMLRNNLANISDALPDNLEIDDIDFSERFGTDMPGIFSASFETRMAKRGGGEIVEDLGGRMKGYIDFEVPGDHFRTRIWRVR